MRALQTKQQDSYTQIQSLINAGIEKWIQAGQLIAKAIDDDPEFKDGFHEQTGIALEVIESFERIGRNELYPHLLINDSPGVRRLRTMDIDMQKRFWSEPVPLLVMDNGKVETLKMDVRSMSPLQARQAFSREGVRSVGAQRAWLEDYRLRSCAPKAGSNLPYRIVKDELVVMEAPCKFTKKQLARLLADME